VQSQVRQRNNMIMSHLTGLLSLLGQAKALAWCCSITGVAACVMVLSIPCISHNGAAAWQNSAAAWRHKYDVLPADTASLVSMYGPIRRTDVPCASNASMSSGRRHSGHRAGKQLRLMKTLAAHQAPLRPHKGFYQGRFWRQNTSMTKTRWEQSY
jgi:hypothetical protein